MARLLGELAPLLQVNAMQLITGAAELFADTCKTPARKSEAAKRYNTTPDSPNAKRRAVSVYAVKHYNINNPLHGIHTDNSMLTVLCNSFAAATYGYHAAVFLDVLRHGDGNGQQRCVRRVVHRDLNRCFDGGYSSEALVNVLVFLA